MSLHVRKGVLDMHVPNLEAEVATGVIGNEWVEFDSVDMGCVLMKALCDDADANAEQKHAVFALGSSWNGFALRKTDGFVEVKLAEDRVWVDVVCGVTAAKDGGVCD